MSAALLKVDFCVSSGVTAGFERLIQYMRQDSGL